MIYVSDFQVDIINYKILEIQFIGYIYFVHMVIKLVTYKAVIEISGRNGVSEGLTSYFLMLRTFLLSYVNMVEPI